MEKYISDLVKAEDIIIYTEIFYDTDSTRHQNVKVIHVPTNIEVVDSSAISQIDAYNKCIKRIEKAIKFKKFKDFYDKYPDKAAEDFMGIKLSLWQKVLIRTFYKNK